MSKVAIIMGSASDWDVMSPACSTLEEFGIPYEKRVLSAHRNPGPLADYVRAARENGFDIIIAGAGGAAHLPGVIASDAPPPRHRKELPLLLPHRRRHPVQLVCGLL